MQAKQKGMTVFGVLFNLIVYGLIILVGIKLFPVYFENFEVKKSLSTLAEEPGLMQQSTDYTRALIDRRFGVNNIKTVKAEQVEIIKQGGRVEFKLEYEVRVNILANIDAVIGFKENLQSK